MKEIFLLRHGKPSITKRYIGITDTELSQEGTKQVTSMQTTLSLKQFDTVYCSPLRRCRQTCDILNLRGDVIIDNRISEIDFGLWEGKSFNEIAKLYPEDVERWSNSPETFHFPDGEKIGSFRHRIIDFCESLKNSEAKKILLITHAGVIRHIICHLLRLPLSNYLYFNVQYGHITTISLYTEGGVLTALNRGVEHG